MNILSMEHKNGLHAKLSTIFNLTVDAIADADESLWSLTWKGTENFCKRLFLGLLLSYIHIEYFFKIFLNIKEFYFSLLGRRCAHGDKKKIKFPIEILENVFTSIKKPH